MKIPFPTARNRSLQGLISCFLTSETFKMGLTELRAEQWFDLRGQSRVEVGC